MYHAPPFTSSLNVCTPSATKDLPGVVTVLGPFVLNLAVCDVLAVATASPHFGYRPAVSLLSKRARCVEVRSKPTLGTGPEAESHLTAGAGTRDACCPLCSLQLGRDFGPSPHHPNEHHQCHRADTDDAPVVHCPWRKSPVQEGGQGCHVRDEPQHGPGPWSVRSPPYPSLRSQFQLHQHQDQE